jgi:putative oxidoreductase
MKSVLFIARALVGGILIYAGFMKAAGPSAEFAAAIAAYKILPAALITPASVALPYIEMWVGLFVLFGLYMRAAALAATFLFSLFLITLSSALLRGIDLASCGCFGADTLSPRYTIVMDAVLLALSVFTYRQTKIPPPYSLDGVLP